MFGGTKGVSGFMFRGVNQGVKTRTPKVVPRKVPLNIVLIWPLYSRGDPKKSCPKTQGYNLRHPR